MFNFKNDYSYIGHERILNALIQYKDESCDVYGLDNHSKNAKELIKKYVNKADLDIHFLVGGTIVNKTVISHLLRPYEAVISVDTGHINVHETGAIEQTGHKVVTVKNYDGKIKCCDIVKVFKEHTDEHMVKPRMVYISQTTEAGTVYTKEELIDIYNTTKKLGMYLFVDGARLATALDKGVMTLEDLANYSDVFYIGATKNGSPLGEAVCIVNNELKDYFRFSIKQNGGMYSKGFVAGICFEELFKDGLYFELGHHANVCAQYLYDGLVKRNISFAYPCSSNQVFPIVCNDLYEKLRKIVSFELWTDLGDKKIIRFVCSFKTTIEMIDDFFETLDELK